jgi:hypothetical protein
LGIAGHPPTNRNDDDNDDNKAKRVPATTTGSGTGDKPSTRHPPLRALTHGMDRVLTALSTTLQMLPVLVSLANEVAVLFFLAHAATIYKGAAFIFYICCLFRVIDIFEVAIVSIGSTGYSNYGVYNTMVLYSIYSGYRFYRLQ